MATGPAEKRGCNTTEHQVRTGGEACITEHEDAGKARDTMLTVQGGGGGGGERCLKARKETAHTQIHTYKEEHKSLE